MAGSHIAVLVEASIDKNRLRVGRIVAAVDFGAQVNPDIARQQVEGGLVFGLASAMGGSASFKRGLPAPMRPGALGLPPLADICDVTCYGRVIVVSGTVVSVRFMLRGCW